MKRRPGLRAAALPLHEVVAMIELLLKLMQRALEGDALDEAIYQRAFGSKEGLVQQLQRLCAIVSEVAGLVVEEQASDHQAAMTLRLSAEQRALAEYYLERLNGGDAADPIME